MTHRVAPAALIVLAAAGLTACGTSDRVDRHDLESQIAAFVHQRTGANVSVRCPDGVHAREGARVQCSTVLSGAPTTIQLQFARAGHFRITQMRLR